MNGGTIVQKISDELTYDSLHENDSGDLPGCGYVLADYTSNRKL